MMKRKRVLLQAFLLSTTAVFMSPSVSHAKKVKIPEQTVLSAFDKAAADAIKGTISVAVASGDFQPLDEDERARMNAITLQYPDVTRQMNAIIDDIWRVSPDKTLRPRVKISDDPELAGRAHDRATISVSRRMVNMLTGKPTDEGYVLPKDQRIDAMAYLLAHEYAHLLYNHHIEMAKKDKDSKSFVSIAASSYGFFLTGQGIVREFGGTIGPEFNDANKKFAGVVAASPWIQAEIHRATYAPYKRKAEQQADFMATDLLSAAALEGQYNATDGADPIRSIYKIYDVSLGKQTERLAESAAETFGAASALMVTSAPAVALNGGDVGAMFSRGLKVAATQFVVDQLFQRLKRKPHLYYSADKRVEAVGTYFDTFYVAQAEAVSPMMLARKEAKRKALEEAWARENAPGAAAEIATEFLANGNIEGAERALAGVTDPNRMSVTRYVIVLGDVATAKQNHGLAASYYSRVLNRQEAPYFIFSKLSKAQAAQAQNESALATLDQGIEKHPETDLIIEKLELLISLDRLEDAQLVAAQCEEVDQKAIRKQCEASIEATLPKEDNAAEKAIGDVGKSITGIFK